MPVLVMITLLVDKAQKSFGASTRITEPGEFQKVCRRDRGQWALFVLPSRKFGSISCFRRIQEIRGCEHYLGRLQPGKRDDHGAR